MNVVSTEALELPLVFAPKTGPKSRHLADELLDFDEFGKKTIIASTSYTDAAGRTAYAPTYINEFWTARQRQAHSLQEISYRACFKPQLPVFFIERLTRANDIVYDPFMGRGTTPLEAALRQRVPYGCDINPLSATLTRPRLSPPSLEDLKKRLDGLNLRSNAACSEELLVFFHPETLEQIDALRGYLLSRHSEGTLDATDDWIRLVALNRLTGHSPGFFSVYTMPPNQAVSCESQAKINKQRNQTPPRRDVKAIILKKSRSLLKDCDNECRRKLLNMRGNAKFIVGSCAATPEMPDNSVNLVVTSPPFLNVVDYATDNWMRCWFLGIDAKSVKLTTPRKLEQWAEAMTKVFHELNRVLKPGGHVAFEVGEVHGGKTRLEETVLPCGASAGLTPLLVLINDQDFTKTANCWGVANNSKGTNTNRIVVFQKPG